MARRKAPAGPLPEPPVPADADLTGFPFMPVSIEDIRTGSLAQIGGAAAWCGFTAQSVAWHQKPAGSLPNNEKQLGWLLGFGRDVNDFRAIRAQQGLDGWFLASDGRLYHADVARKVLNALSKKRANAQHTEAARKKALERRAERASTGTFESEENQRVLTPSDEQSETSVFKTGMTSTPRLQVIEVVEDGPSLTEVRREEKEIRSKGPACLPVPWDPACGEPLERGRLPKLSDPEFKWAVLTSEFGLDGQGKRHPVVKGFFLDIVCREVCKAAGINDPNWRGDWDTVARWLHAGLRSNCILDAIEDRASRHRYKPPAVLRYFDGIVTTWAKDHPGPGRDRSQAPAAAYG